MAARVVGVDHLALRVRDFARSHDFYAGLLGFLGFKPMAESGGDAAGWSNGKTRLWIGQAESGHDREHRIGDVGIHHYAFALRSRRDVDALEEYLKENGIEIVDPAGEYYEDYYAVFFLDPDGIKLEGMKYGETKRKRAAKAKAKTPKRKASHKKK